MMMDTTPRNTKPHVYYIVARLVGIMLQIFIIILFQISLKISSLCSFYASDSIIILHLQFSKLLNIHLLTTYELLYVQAYQCSLDSREL